MRDEAKANEESDKLEKDKIEKVNAADSMIFQTEKQLKEFGEKLSEGNKTAIEGALIELRAAHGTRDVSAIDAAMEKINTAWQAASQEIYNAQQETASQGASNPEAGEQNSNATSDENVTDVNFEEVK